MTTQSMQIERSEPKPRKKVVLDESTIMDLKAQAFPKSTRELFPFGPDPDPNPDPEPEKEP
jgi:hypothetical protein